MSFDKDLAHLKEALEGQRGWGDQVLVNRRSLQELYMHFMRLDRAERERHRAEFPELYPPKPRTII